MNYYSAGTFVLFNDVFNITDYIVSNDTVICEKTTRNKVEGSGRGIIQNNILVFSWREWGNHENPRPGQPARGPIFEFGNTKLNYCPL